MATYILQKDLPDSKIGDKYIFNSSQKAYYKNGNVQDSYWIPEYVENNPEWFLKKEEKGDYTIMFNILPFNIQKNEYEQAYHNFINSSNRLTNEKCEAIKKAIEIIMNGSNSIDVVETKYVVNKVNSEERKYTEEDMHKCWDYAEEGSTGHYSTLGSFEDYINSLNKE